MNLDPDSAGVYYLDGADVNTLSLRYKMELLWQYHDSVEVAVLGSSRPMYGVNSMLIKTGFTVNFAQTPNSIYLSHYLLKNYLLNNSNKLKYVVISLDLDFWNKDEFSDWNYFYAKAPGFIYDQHHSYWEDGVPQNLYDATKNSPGNSDDTREYYTHNRGNVWQTSGTWFNVAEIEQDSTWYATSASLYQSAFNCLETILALAGNRGVYVIGVIFPQSPAYRKTGSFGRYGLQRSIAPGLIQNIKNLETTYPNFHLMDENKMGDHDYTDAMAFDYDHLSYLGAAQLTHRLDSLLNTLK
jgi:hypothetical protein